MPGTGPFRIFGARFALQLLYRYPRFVSDFAALASKSDTNPLPQTR